MAEVIGRAGSKINIRLGQSPEYRNPEVDMDLQQTYNALHLLSQYLDVLRENLESAPGQNPAESIRFRRRFWGPAGQKIVQGAIVSSLDGKLVNGVLSNDAPAYIDDGGVSIGSTGTRDYLGMKALQFFVALTDAEPDELVQVGVGPGVSQITGTKCGQIVWASDSRTINSERGANTSSTQTVTGRDPTENGGIYLANVTGYWVGYSKFGYNWEGYWMPGYPDNSGGTYYYNRAFLYPIGVCIADGYVLFKDYIRVDSLPHNFQL